jgi:ketosteroid isomerase-like protein
MKHKVMIGVLLCLLISGGFAMATLTRAQDEKSEEMDAISAVLNSYVAAVEAEDVEAYSMAVAHDTDITWIGTDEPEWFVGYDALEQGIAGMFEALDNIAVEVSEETIHVSADGQWAWATSRWVFSAEFDGEPFSVPLRTTWILENRESGWVIVHFHKSVGVVAE